jgi:(R)-2-hydroxyacyl-CoA dehydratese activating ATPase
MIVAGIDAGSRAIKAALFDAAKRQILASAMVDQGVEQERLAGEALARALEVAGVARDRVAGIVATGYGRNAVGFADTTVTEITCHSRGVRHLSPDARTVIEIGGQDTKVIRLDPGGAVRDFSMNDRCAAGSGRFLELVASRLGVDLPALSELGRQSAHPVSINSTCVVFAETEIIGLLAAGAARSDIAAGVQAAIATRVGTLAARRCDAPVYFTGGVALQSGMVAALERVIGCPIRESPAAQYTGAFGAAIIAAQRCNPGWDS